MNNLKSYINAKAVLQPSPLDDIICFNARDVLINNRVDYFV